MSVSESRASAAPHLRLVGLDDDAGGETLTTWFERSFVPRLERDGAGAATIGGYRESLGYWEKLTERIAWRRIEQRTVDDFRKALALATYRRGPFATQRPLSPFTVFKHSRQLRRLLKRIAWRNKFKLRMRLKKPHRLRPKPCFSLEDARRIAAAAAAVTDWQTLKCRKPPAAPSVIWLGALIDTLYYTGIRIGTLRRLRPEMIVAIDGAEWIDAPGTIVKTKKPIFKFLHPAAAASLKRLIAANGAEAQRVFPWPQSGDALADCLARLSERAGLPVKSRLSPHAWRRTNSRQMALAGLNRATWSSQMALDHEDSATTREFYLEIEPEIIRRLPRLSERLLF
jgi:integrase